MEEVQLAYGIRDGRVILISEIKQTERGERCDCVCPVCKGKLLAKLGEIRQPHFAHKPNCKCDYSHAQQTSLHILAKEIIQENNRILVPGIAFTRNEIIGDYFDDPVATEIEIDCPNIIPKTVLYSSVELEKQIGETIADAVIMTNNSPCIVEIAVTHFVDKEKRKKLEVNHLPAFEIDLSSFVDTPPSREAIAEAVLSNEKNRKWIVNPKRERLLTEKKEEFTQKCTELKTKRKSEELEKKKISNKEKTALQELFLPDNYTKEIKNLRNDNAAAFRLEKYSFAEGIEEYPFYMNIPITGEFVFPCDRRIWQGKLFDDYIYRGFGKDVCTFTISGVKDRILKKGIIPYDQQKIHSTTVILNGREQTIILPYDVIKRYFEYLELLGFIIREKKGWSSRRPTSLNPPNQRSANIVKTVIEAADHFSPYVDQTIKEEILLRLPEHEKSVVLSWEEE
jgi:hypothetical protein